MYLLITLACFLSLSNQFLPSTKPDPVPRRWLPLVGTYVAGDDTILVREENGALELLLNDRQNGRRITLLEVDSLRAEFVASEQLPGGTRAIVFSRVSEDSIVFVNAGRRYLNTTLPLVRKPFRIIPRRNLEELRAMAMATSPPAEKGAFRSADLVDPVELDSTIRLDIRYATANNFLGTPVYSAARAFLQRPAAEALVRAHRWLARFGYGLLIHDAYRPWYVTKMFWEATPPELRDFVADPSRGSRHNRGCAVDLTLYDLKSGEPVEMVSGYDEFSHRAYPDYPGGTTLQRWHRDLLRKAMEQEGFAVYRWEWWHFDFAGWEQYPILNVPFESVNTARRQ